MTAEEITALATRLGTELLLGALLGQVDFILSDDTDEDGYTPCSIGGDRPLPPAITNGLRAFLGAEATSWAHSLSLSGNSCSCGWVGENGQLHMHEAIRG